MRRQVPEGHKAWFQHLRYSEADAVAELQALPDNYRRADVTAANDRLRDHAQTKRELGTLPVSPTGGITVAHVIDMYEEEVACAEATCSILDQYSRRLGRDIALGRALAALERFGAQQR